MIKRIMTMIIAGSILFGCVPKNYPNEYPYYGIKYRHFFDISRLWKSDHEAGVERFLSQAFVGGLPYNEMKNFSGDVKTLSRLLETKCGKNEKGYLLCSHIVATLGVIGGKEAGEAIRKFLKEDEVSDFRSKTDGLMALGYWVNDAEEKGNDASRTITDLISCISASSYSSVLPPSSGEPSGEPSCPIPTPANKKLTSEERDVVRSAIISLGLSGSLKDRRVLRVLQALLDKAPANSSFRALIMETLKAHGTVALDGLVCYYERKSRECQRKRVRVPSTAPGTSPFQEPIKEIEDKSKDARAPNKETENQEKDQQAPNKEPDEVPRGQPR